MSRPTKHGTDAILDAALELVLAEGPRAASISAIANASGAPVGTLYHRFGSRDGLLVELWLRSLARFQELCLLASRDDDPLSAGAAMAAASVEFARSCPHDARLLLSLRRRDLLDADSSGELKARLDAMNEPLRATVRRIARDLYGRASERNVERVTIAVADLPAGAVRRHVTSGKPVPTWLEAEVRHSAATLLSATVAPPR